MVAKNVKVKLPLLLRKFAGGQEVVEVAGYDITECLGNLTAQFPDLRKWLFTKQGEEVATHVRLFVNGELHLNVFCYQSFRIRTRCIQDGDELSILIAVSGG